MSDPLSLQQTLFYTVSRALENFKKIGKNNYTPATIRSRMTVLNNAWAQCLQTHAAILQAYQAAKREKIEYFQADQMGLYEDLYNAALDYMVNHLEELEPNVSPNYSLNSTTVHSEFSALSQHLPAIQLPSFSGNFEEWESFRDRFTALIIKNKDLSAFSRMHFLVSSLTGSARNAIASLSVTADNFDIAWKALTARFENKRKLIEMHVSTLFSLPTLSRESASELHALRNKVEKALASLKRLERSSNDILDDILVFCISQKLDTATRHAWKLKFSDNSPPATYEELMSFLASRAIALEELKPIKALNSSRDNKVTSATASTMSHLMCVLCKKQHWLN